MVDRDARDRFAELLRHLVAGQITNDDFATRLPLSSGDPAVNQIFWNGAWLLYDDLREYRLVGSYRLPREPRREVARWILFLKSDLTYEWPRLLGYFRFPWYFLNVLSLGLLGFFVRRRLLHGGNLDVWPFYRESDYEVALARPPYFARAL
jgi:hypothetical protein